MVDDKGSITYLTQFALLKVTFPRQQQCNCQKVLLLPSVSVEHAVFHFQEHLPSFVKRLSYAEAEVVVFNDTENEATRLRAAPFHVCRISLQIRAVN